jgi:competence protein ComEC
MIQLKYLSFILIVLVILTVGCTHTFQPKTNVPDPMIVGGTSNLTVTFIDVGQGDSEWIVSPNGKTMLIDTGESDEVLKVSSVIPQYKVIDIVVATHPHADHIGGMNYILKTHQVRQFIDSGYPHTSSVYETMLSTILEKNINYSDVRTEDIIDFDPDVRVEVISPLKLSDDINDNSVVMLMTYRNVTFLFTGDAGSTSEMRYATKLTHVDIFKVSHHGSSSATSDYLISRIHPDVSIISVGKDNQYNHPDKSVIDRLKNDGSRVYRTDVDGTIIVTTNGEQYSVIV